MIRFSHLLPAILTLCFISSSCEYTLDETRKEKRAKEEAQRELDEMLKGIEDLRKERDQINELNKQSLKEIETYEKKRLAAERAEQIRIKADQLELQGLYDNKLKKIKQQQRFIWDGYTGKTYDSLNTTDGKTYTKGKVIGVDATGIALQHQNGVTRIPFALFGEDIQKKNITDFDKQIEALKRWLDSETEEREFIRNKAMLDAEKEFE